MNIYLSNYPTQHNTPSPVFFPLPLSSRPELLASLQAPFISSHSKLKDSIRAPPLCQKDPFPSSLSASLWESLSKAGPRRHWVFSDLAIGVVLQEADSFFFSPLRTEAS